MGKHKEWRKLAKKQRRKHIRQQVAQERCALDEEKRMRRESSPSYAAWLEEQTQLEVFRQEEEARLAAEAEAKWLAREVEAQKSWNELQLKLQFSREEKARQNAKIKAEWEAEQKKLKELKDQLEQEAEEKRLHQESVQKEIDDFIANGGDIPETLKVSFETNPNKVTCPFFSKTSTCRFKDTCSRNHIRPAVSCILLIPNFYTHYSLQRTDSEYGSDCALEYSRTETYNHFKEFFFDVMPEMEKCGHVAQFKVCCNNEAHLRGNVYVEYRSSREAMKGYRMFNGRFYGGKQLSVEFSGITSWKSAICGLFFKKKCPKGNACNFLHVFRNPGNMFANADKDLHRTPSQPISSEQDARNWRWSESPERIPLLETKREENHRRRKRSSERHRKEHVSRKKSRHKHSHSRRSSDSNSHSR